VKMNHIDQKLIIARVHLCELGKTGFREKVENRKLKDPGRIIPPLERMYFWQKPQDTDRLL